MHRCWLVPASYQHRPKDYPWTVNTPYFDHNEWLKYGRRMVEIWLKYG
ncbi:MAG: hypothetical protein IJQ14_07975 [Bacteroidales bacterium]|nr:hypothetical protein [Bacteroidales bacterium]